TGLVNEMAWSQGLVEHYLDAGYETLVMEWNNPRRHHPEWKHEWRYRPVWTESPGGERIAVLWADAVAFQKFQRAVVDDLEIAEYVDWVRGQGAERPRHLFLYASDAEVFDWRPGRFAAEPPPGEGEWRRLREVLAALHAAGVSFTTPARVRADPAFRPPRTLCLRSAADPIPVKKQPKYNATRWALSGWDDVGLNSECHARARALTAAGTGPEEWRALCRDWASDLRTHLTEKRWRAHRERIARAVPPAAEAPPGPPLAMARVESRGRHLVLETDGVRATLIPRRGLAIAALGFSAAGPADLAGTLPHGHFDDIDWAADFYSGHTVVEMPARARVTDLERVEPAVDRRADRLEVHAVVPTALGPLAKRVTLFADCLELRYGFSAWGERPLGSLRTAILTLLPENLGEDLTITCANGGAPETFRVNEECDHGASVSPLVSATAAFGATDGELRLDDGRIGLELAWRPEEAAALPLLTHQRIGGKRFLRIAFSLSEVDETHRPGAPLRDFRLTIRGRRLAE
ncbi:MAG: glycoside hydrolase family 57, partial [Planctomycetota bacterium]